MRRISDTLLLLLVMSLAGLAQGYMPIVRSGVEWDVMHGGPEICWLTGGDRYSFHGDSVIAGKTYSKVWAWRVLQVNSGPYCPPFYVDTTSMYLADLLREDTVTRQVFKYDAIGQGEVLLYDFTLVAGDTLALTYPGSAGALVVDSIGTEMLLTGTVVRRFFLNNGESYAESIGGSQGLHNLMFQGPGAWEVPGCILENGVQLWGGNCLGSVGVEDALLQAKPWKLVPMEAGLMQVQGPSGKVGKLSLSDAVGRMVLQAEVRVGETLKVPAGLLVWSIQWEGALAGGKLLQRD